MFISQDSHQRIGYNRLKYCPSSFPSPSNNLGKFCFTVSGVNTSFTCFTNYNFSIAGRPNKQWVSPRTTYISSWTDFLLLEIVSVNDSRTFHPFCPGPNKRFVIFRNGNFPNL